MTDPADPTTPSPTPPSLFSLGLPLLLPALQGHLADTLIEALKDTAHGAAEDLQQYGAAMAHGAAFAAMSQSLSLQKEIRAQALLLLEKHRLRVAQSERAAIEKNLDLLLQFGIKAMTAALAAAMA